MKTEELIPDHFPQMKEEDLVAATQRREKYSVMRDLQAQEFNGAIISRMEKDKEKLEAAGGESGNPIKCLKCGKEFSIGIDSENLKYCPDCK
jgi:predicted Zn-ribbon and HTH transcriptional regulator